MASESKRSKSFERMLYIFVAVLVVLRLTASYMELKAKRSAIMEPTPSPSFSWRDFDSDPHDFSTLKGKVVVLHFWASWCGPCRTEFPSLLRAAETLKDDAVFLTISSDDTDTAARKFLATAKEVAKVRPDNVLYGWDPMKKLTFDLFQTVAMPETIIIDRGQVMRRKYVGMTNWEDPAIINYIRDLKKGVSTSPNPASNVPVPQ